MLRRIGGFGITWVVAETHACSLSHTELCPTSAVVPTANGPVQGFNREVEGQTVSSFWGLPFAEPPVLERRFHYPETYNKTWHEIFVANQRANFCPQYGGDDANPGDEDCLYLNVYAPANVLGIAESPLPVMFWIYGGGFRKGSAYFNLTGSNIMYDGARLAGRHDVVVVTINYRLNALGFNTYTTGPDGQTGTQAMEDQRLAMKWTHANINAFGGDASRVTIFGESAGAFSVMYHLVSPPSWPYFSQAIMQSGVSEQSWFFQPKDLASDLYESWAEALQCPAGESRLQCLQAKPASAFCAPPDGLHGRSPAFPTFTVGPVIDGTEHGLQALPAEMVKAGKFAPVPLIAGANKDGGSIFEPLVANLVPGAHIEALDKHDVDLILNWAFSDDDQAKIRSAYKPAEFGSLSPMKYQRQVSHMMRDLAFMCSDRLLASNWHARGLDAFVYSFSFNFGELDKLSTLGDFHGVDILFVWRSFLWVPELLPLSGFEQRMADIMSCQWASFAHSGNPNGVGSTVRNCEEVHGKVADWPTFTSTRQYYSLQASHEFGGPKVRALRAHNTYPDDEFPSDSKCDMWDTVSYPWHSKPVSSIAV